MSTTKLVFFTLLTFGLGQYEGDECLLMTLKIKGTCTIIDKCPSALNLLKMKQTPQHCGFHGSTPIVCCPKLIVNEKLQYHPGQISYEKCLSYYNTTQVQPAFSGVRSLAAEFPHMAILGYNDTNDPKWLCGGSLISDRFVLTAAHCLYSQKFGNVKIVRLGDLDIKNTTDNAAPEDFQITEAFRHPKYQSPSKYNDIALLQLDRTVYFGVYIKPACLYVTNAIPKQQVTATGWGVTDFLGEPSSHLLKVFVGLIDSNECRSAYSNTPARQLEQGILENIQVCAGNVSGADTCPGDSGGPLQISFFNKDIRKDYYQIIGVTSFGKACGFKNSVGVYTRVSGYVSWIESIVWKDDYISLGN